KDSSSRPGMAIRKWCVRLMDTDSAGITVHFNGEPLQQSRCELSPWVVRTYRSIQQKESYQRLYSLDFNVFYIANSISTSASSSLFQSTQSINWYC
ncbi:MAG: hypothetical protein RR943_06270, partial [Comamonas sp.]